MSFCNGSSCVIRHQHSTRAAEMRFPVLGCSNSRMHEAWTYVLAGEYCRQSFLRRHHRYADSRVLLSQNGKRVNAAVYEGQWVMLNRHWTKGNLPRALLDRIVRRYVKGEKHANWESIRREASDFYDLAFEKSLPYSDVARALS